jgi:hypothetical protein
MLIRNYSANPGRGTKERRNEGTKGKIRLFFRGLAAIIYLTGLFHLGCARGHQAAQNMGYDGPTESMAAVISHINANNRAIPTLYAKHYLEASIFDRSTNKTTFVNASGDLFVYKPREMLLRGKKDGVGKVFEMGSTREQYWFTVFIDNPTQWWGNIRNIGKKCSAEIPIRPDLIGEVLGIGNINSQLMELPSPTMRFNNDLDVYMFVWSNRLPDHWYAEKEIWYDRGTYRPRKVLLFDDNGRIVLRANLGEYRQIPVANVSSAQQPWIATSFHLYFPENRSTMTLTLSDLSLTTKTGAPKPGTIVFKEESRDDMKVIQIDADCDE